MCSFEQLLLLLSFFCSTNAQTDDCGNGKDDIGPLISVNYWKMTIPEKDCEFFPGSSCTIYMKFCDALPSESTLCNNDTLGPTSVCVTDGTDGYSLGEENNNPFVKDTSLLTARFTNGSDSLCTSDTIQTDIVFSCDPLAKWESARENDVSSFFGSIIVDFEDFCKVTINVHYDRVCEEVVCEGGAHDISPLTSPDHWEADVHIDQCYELFGKHEKCTLYLSFCENMKDIPGCANSTVCISIGGVYYRFGQYSEYINPFALSTGETVDALYFFGKNYTHCIDENTKANVLLECSPGHDWNYTDGKPDATEHLLSIRPSPEGPCVVLVTMNYTGACSPAPPLHGDSSDEGPGVGWVGLGLLIGLVVIVTLYLTIGSAINIAKGKSGCPEMLPQFAFWRAFFIYVIEGVYFTADLCTCGWCSRTAGPAPSSNYDKL